MSSTPTPPSSRIVRNLQPPYYAVIFTSQRTPGDRGYGAMAEHMVDLAAQQPGFLGVESVRDAEGVGITVSYWENEAAILAWKRNAEHREAQRRGKDEWYAAFQLRICRVEREHGM
ncbi:MAG: antibiotic biosynthesis monooxygenase [Verrucomicrobiales bacterium]|nr:antibiotic biosynthesis monooxygenase [Verrucomicrobiales bacterium]